MIKHLILEELKKSGKTAFMTFGRFNPPTRGHEKLVTTISNKAFSEDGDFFIFPSKTTDANKLPADKSTDIKLNKVKNPFEFSFKFEIMKKAFPALSKNIINSEKEKIVNVLNALVYIYERKQSGKPIYQNVSIIVGGDRVDEFKKLVEKYNDIESAHGYYKFDTITVEGISRELAHGGDDISSSKMREWAVNGDFENFKKGCPNSFSSDDATIMYNKLRAVYQVESQDEV